MGCFTATNYVFQMYEMFTNCTNFVFTNYKIKILIMYFSFFSLFWKIVNCDSSCSKETIVVTNTTDFKSKKRSNNTWCPSPVCPATTIINLHPKSFSVCRKEWASLGNMEREEAMVEFVKLLNKCCNLFAPYVTSHKIEREEQERKR